MLELEGKIYQSTVSRCNLSIDIKLENKKNIMNVRLTGFLKSVAGFASFLFLFHQSNQLSEQQQLSPEIFSKIISHVIPQKRIILLYYNSSSIFHWLVYPYSKHK